MLTGASEEEEVGFRPYSSSLVGSRVTPRGRYTEMPTRHGKGTGHDGQEDLSSERRDQRGFPTAVTID